MGGNVLGAGVVFCGDTDDEQSEEKATPGGDADETQSKTRPSKTQKVGSGLISRYRIADSAEMISVDAIVIDPENRDGECIKLNDVLTKAEQIESQGFDLSKVRIVLVQLPLDTKERRVILNTNTKWREEDPRFPTFEKAKVEFSCVGGNHLVTFLKMAKQSIVCDSFVSVTPQGGGEAAISLNALTQSDSDFANAVTDKVPCVVLRREVRDIPEALHQIQSSENAGHTLITPESDKQCMLRIAKATLATDFDRVLTVAKLQKEFPHLREFVGDYCSFVAALGGGGSPHWRHWKICDARFTERSCHLRGSLLQQIADLPAELVRVKCACALAARMLPKGFVRNVGGAVVDWFTKTDIITNVGAHNELHIAEDMLAEMGAHVTTALAGGCGVDNSLVEWQFLARLDARIARLLAKKAHKSLHQFDSLAEIAEETRHEVANFKHTQKVAPTRSVEERRGAATSTCQVSI